ncbi:hypothetical protein AAC03nite_19300 [Alicyclobacillus acidoterrestris]|uniref:DUF5325 family protein n=1 Tax=Alicyclobacillus suci TaxID=2816080 RepID=UPI001193FB9D|nr:DUF5325 family protein [Alicyclobacillus suci]GEO26145.1 hypothetical protein AAC03nite_19300 [Alicyclobacillus acidoterrestris]
MTTSFKILFFFISLFTMACFALGSVMMAQGRGWLATLFFVLAVLITGLGFVTKRRLVRPQSQ